MSAPDYAAQVLHLGLSLSLLWVLAFAFWRNYRIDATRDRLFELRDRMFDFAADGHVPFDSPAYARLRVIMNSVIRFTHRITFARLLFILATHKLVTLEYERDYYREWVTAVNALQSEDAKRRLQQFHVEMWSIVVRHMLTGSPILWVCFLIASIALAIQGATKRSLQAFATRIPGQLLLEAEAVEAQEEARRSSEMALA